MKETITKALGRIEKEHGVKIILACESGSRAWGFPSRDSDYDVRFIFVNPKDAYLSVASSRLAFMPKTSCHHYLAMARRSVELFKEKEKVKLKTYMYAIRPVLCCQWIIDRMAQPPMRMDDLLAGIGADRSFKEEVSRLIARKKDQTEKDTVHRSEIVEDYLHQKIAALPNRIPDNPPKPDPELFDKAFRSILEYLNI